MKKIIKKPVLVAICILLSCTLVVTVVQGTGAWLTPGSSTKYKCLYDELITEKGFIYGVNAPWVNGSSNMGLGGNTVAELQGATRDRDDSLDDYKRILTNCKAIGYDAVKIWLFGTMRGIRISETGDILGFDEFFMNDFTAFMDYAQKIGIAIDVTLLPHQESSYTKYGVDIYNKLTQFVVNPTYRQHYLDKIVKPVCEVLDKKYRDTILSVTLYCEPEGDTYAEGAEVSGNYLYGTTWDKLVECMNAMSACVKENLPDVPVTATSGWNPWKTYRFNDVDLDIVGVDVYNNESRVPNPENMMVNKPMWATEFGQDTTDYNHSNDFHIANTLSFYENAKENGYTGAFYWSFNGYAPLSVTYSQNTYSALRPIAAVLHYKLLDEEYQRNGIDSDSVADKPSLLYGDDPLTLQWIASRDAETYRIERSTNASTWSTFKDNIDAESVTDSANICSCDISTDDQGKNYYYRVIVTTTEGLKAISKALDFYMPKITCSDSENLLVNGNFDNGTLDGWKVGKGISVYEKVAVGDTNTGNYCAKLPGLNDNSWQNFHQTVTLKANTQYRVTFYSKHRWDTYTKNFSLSSNKTVYYKEKIAVGNNFTLNTYTFTTGDEDEDVTVYFIDNFEPIYIDSVYLFEIS